MGDFRRLVCFCNPINMNDFNTLWYKFQTLTPKQKVVLHHFFPSDHRDRPDGSLLQCVLSLRWRRLAERYPKLVRRCIFFLLV